MPWWIRLCLRRTLIWLPLRRVGRWLRTRVGLALPGLTWIRLALVRRRRVLLLGWPLAVVGRWVRPGRWGPARRGLPGWRRRGLLPGGVGRVSTGGLRRVRPRGIGRGCGVHRSSRGGAGGRDGWFTTAATRVG